METGKELMMALSYSYDLVKSGPEDGARDPCLCPAYLTSGKSVKISLSANSREWV